MCGNYHEQKGEVQACIDYRGGKGKGVSLSQSSIEIVKSASSTKISLLQSTSFN